MMTMSAKTKMHNCIETNNIIEHYRINSSNWTGQDLMEVKNQGWREKNMGTNLKITYKHYRL